VVPQDLALYDDLSALENLKLFGALYGLRGKLLGERIEMVLGQVNLADRARDKPATFSGGMKRRLNIAAALMHDPQLLILDEPTVGVDPQSRNAIFDTLEALQAQGKALIYTSHYMEEVERLADHIVIIDHGKVLADESPASLHSRLAAQAALRVELAEPAHASLLDGLRAHRGVISLSCNEPQRRRARHRPGAGGRRLARDGLAAAGRLPAAALRHRTHQPRRHLPDPDRTQPARLT
jgi:ABC-2 type transport system ATP-binding protein